MENLQKQVNDLRKELNLLKGANTIPLDVQRAFEKRIGGMRLENSTHTGETKTVDEAGATTYTVMSPANGFLKVIHPTTGNYVEIPYF